MPKALWLLIIGMVINVTGSSFLWPLNTIYIHDHLGKSLTVAGLILVLNAGAGILGNLYGGTLFDKIGGYKAILAGIIVTLISSGFLIFFHGFVAYAIILVGIGFGSGMIFPSMFAMAGTVWKEGGRKSFNAIYVAQNVGVAIGAALGGIVASYKFDYIFFANSFMYLCFFVLVFLGYKKMAQDAFIAKAEQTNILEQNNAIKNKTKLHALLILTAGYLICWIAYVQWQTTIATHTQSLGISLKQYSLLWSVNGALIVLAQPLVSIAVKWFRTLKQQIILGIVIFIGSFVLVANVEHFTGFMAAMIILTVGEMFVWPAVPTAANELAPEGRAGFYQGVVNSTATAGRMIGPVAGGMIVDLFGMSQLFVVLIGIFVISVATTLVYDRRIKEAQPAKIATSSIK